MAWAGQWAPRVGARCCRQDDPRHVGIILALFGTSTEYGPAFATARVMWLDNGFKSDEPCDELMGEDDGC